MQTQTMQGIVAIAVFRIATHGVTHISRVHTDLVLTTRLELELHKLMVPLTGQRFVMGKCRFGTVG